MVHTLIVGIDTVAGRALAKQVTKRGHVAGLWFDAPEFVDGCHTSRIDDVALKQQIAEADVVVFCGDASRSSWDAGFGQFESEERWLRKCVDEAKTENRKLIFLSSDAVFCGPWVFHDDDSSSLSGDSTAKKLRKLESVVARVSSSLVVRSNIIGAADGTFFQETVDLLRAEQNITLDAATFATPIAADDFAEAVERCIAENVCGYINIAGAERTTPFRFAINLANSLNLHANGIAPLTGNGSCLERSLRCQRLRLEVNMQSPLMRETLEKLTELILEQSERTAAA